MKQTARLENWYKIGNSLFGHVYDHPNCPDGQLVQTSSVLNLDEENNKAETKNTSYALGKKYE